MRRKKTGKPMEMHQVRYFLAVTRLLNFTRAAEECNVAQPSLTRAIKQLEEEFGQDLFRRERNLTHLTDFGCRMTPFLQQCYVSVSLIVSHLAELSRAFDGLELKFLRGTRDEVAEHLKKGEVDIAIAGQ